MRPGPTFLVFVLASSVSFSGCIVDQDLPPDEVEAEVEPLGPFTARSTAFAHGEPMPEKYSCDADNVSPPLQFADIPTKARSIALIMLDHDAPHPSAATRTVIHWTFWNLPANVTSLPEKADLASYGAREGDKGNGARGYSGPCPPAGTHKYVFTFHAMDSILELAAGASLSDLEREVARHSVAQSEFYGTYARLLP